MSPRFSVLVTFAGLPHIRLHDLLHAHPSLMLQRGVHPEVIARRLGRATVSITLDIYGRMLPGLQAEAAEQLDAWLGRYRSTKSADA